MATVEMTKENMDSLIDGNDTVLIDFWAAWCGPCRTFAPIFEKVSEEHPNLVFAKVDTEAQPELAQMFGVRAIPTLFVFREQIGVFEQAGVLPADALESLIEQVGKLDMNDVRKKLEEHAAEHQHSEA